MRHLSAPAAVSVVAGAATFCTLIVAFLFWVAFAGWRTLPSFFFIIPLLFLCVASIGFASWAAARQFVGQDEDELERLQTNVQCFETELDERQRAARAHAAVARLMSAAVRQLADGDSSARVTLDLPEPYRRFRDDFNALAERLEAKKKAAEAQAIQAVRIDGKAREIGEAAEHLMRRAGNLAERIDTDLAAIEAGAGRHTAQALQLAQYTMGGVRIATNRNIEAAARFAELGRLVAEHARNVLMATRSDFVASQPQEPSPQVATVPMPASVGSAALKLVHGHD